MTTGSIVPSTVGTKGERRSLACSQHQSRPNREIHHVSTTFQLLWRPSLPPQAGRARALLWPLVERQFLSKVVFWGSCSVPSALPDASDRLYLWHPWPPHSTAMPSLKSPTRPLLKKAVTSFLLLVEQRVLKGTSHSWHPEAEGRALEAE